MKIWFDTEFIDDGHTIDLLSIGMVTETGNLYLESSEADHSRACPWVRQNVLPHLDGKTCSREEIARAVLDFAGPEPEFWAWFAAYDWVALCQLFGRMVDLPKHWPMRCNDVAQFAEGHRITARRCGPEHKAIVDALWTYEAWYEVTKMKAAA